MTEDSAQPELDMADELLDLLPRLLQQVRANIPREVNSASLLPEWQDIAELRATTGQIRLLRILNTHQGCTMQELADLLDVAPPTATVMVKRLLTLGFVERLRDEQDWRVVRVLPTDRGKRSLALYDQFRRSNLQRRLAHLSQEELAQLRVALAVLHHILEVQL
ncbi:MAG: MarR family transcriptional regulator [Chloroflexota bacterium]|nr:MarR family transcriptional regulator [Chloroflexota bacterium]